MGWVEPAPEPEEEAIEEELLAEDQAIEEA
jgi:hypothetical protein